MTMTSTEAAYLEPVSRLLELGAPRPEREDREPSDDPDWLDYSQYGIGPEQVDELIRLACDVALYARDINNAGTWGPLHAWRALGRRRAASATEPLLALVRELDLDDWVEQDLPRVFGLIGAPAIGPVADFVADMATSECAAIIAIDAMVDIAIRHPECRADCIVALERRLHRTDRVDIHINGSIVGGLVELNAIEAIDTIRDAFQRDDVSVSKAGDLEDVEISLRLRTKRDTRRKYTPREVAREFLQKSQARVAPQVEKPKKVRRNELCPCGSRRKYKKCCGSATNVGLAPT